MSRADGSGGPGGRRRGRVRPGPRPGPGGRSGITLLELVAALLIISLAVAVAVPAFLGLGREDDQVRAARRVETLFRLARDSAIASGLPVTVVIDSVTELVWLDTPRRIYLGSQQTPVAQTSLFNRADTNVNLALLGGEAALEELKPGEPLGLPDGVRMELPRARTRFIFQPTGAALADTLLLTGAFGVMAVTVDPWTGDVRIR